MTAQFLSATTFAIALAVPLSHGQDGPTGYLPLTAQQQAYADANMIKVTRASPNRLALERVEAEQQKNRTILAPGTVIPSAAEDGTEVFGYKGATDPSPAGRFSLNATSMAYPRKVDNSKEAWFPVVGSQSPFGSCASYSSTYYTMTSQVARLRGWNMKADNNPAHLFSPRFTYNLLNNGADSGSNHLSAYWIQCSTGCATYADFPYIPTDCLSWPTQASVWRDAINYRMKETGSVVGLDTEGGLAIAKQMIADGYVFNFAAYIGGWQWVSLANDPATSADDYLFAPGVTNDARLVVSHCNAGGVDHAMTVVGYDDDVWSDLNANGVVDPSEKGALRIVNSWGESFKDKGFTWVSYDSLKSTSAVAGFTTATRQPTFADKKMDWVSARASYTPALVAEVTATHSERNQMELNIGCGSASETQPSSTKWFNTLTGAGGALAFNGTNIPVEATFVIDCTDLINKPNNDRWFAFLGDRNGSSTGTLSSVRFIDSGNVVTTVNTTNPSGGLPQVANNSVVYAYSDNAMPTNIAPVVKNQVTRVIKGVSSSILLDGSDDNSDNLTYSIVTGPSHGTLSTSGANRFYTSNSTYQGLDSFTFKANDGKADSNVGTVTIQVGAAGSGVLAQFFYAINQQNLPDLTGRISELTRIDSQINYQSISDFPNAFISHFAARHTGYINIPTTGSYTFSLNANDAANLWLDGNLIATKYSSDTVTLTAGYHSLRTEYCQEYDSAALRLSWEGPNIGQEIVPESVLFSPVIPNIAPVTQSQNVSIIGDKLAPVAIPLVATDGNQDLLGYATSSPVHGTLFGVGANIKYLPDPGYVGSDSFTFKVNDGTVDSNTATITINISTNAPPTVATAATAAPSIVTTGTTTTLNVLGANDGGEDSLVYAWAATGTPPAAVSFSGNGTNGGKTSTATFSKTGNYTLQCTIKDAGNLTVVSNSVAVTVNRAETADVVLVPNAATIKIAGIQQFTVGRRDQFGNVLEDQIPYLWSLSDSTSGSISPTGLFRANLTTGGPYTVSATGGGRTFSATITVGAFSVPPGPDGYTWCANEGESFTLLEPSDVAFGMTGRYAYKLNQTGTIVFNNTAFYPDPAPGQFKYGFVKPVSTNKAPTLVSVASATTAPSGTAVTLSALGADDTGEPGLTYTWQTLGTPPAVVTFGANGSNTAKSCTATCSQAGLYVFRCTINDVGNATVTSDVVATVVAGTTPVELNPLPITDGLVLRMDASRISDTLDGAQVNTWADTSGAANHAARQATSSTGYPKYVASGINGKPVVRFNSPTQNTGDYLKFSRLSTIRTVFWVMKENAGLADTHFLLGDSINYDFHRGGTPNGPLWDANYSSINIRNGATKLMGSPINGTTTSLPSGNFQLVSLVTAGNVTADQICQDRTFHGSWQGDIAEILIYDRALTSEEENQVGTYLGLKYGLATSYNALPVADGLVLRMDASKISGTADGAQLDTWMDASGAANNAVRQSGSSTGYPKYVANGVNGKPVVRFNSPTGSAGDSFKFNRISTIQSVFWVIKENAGLADTHFLLGDSVSYDFHRGFNTNGTLWSPYNASTAIRNGVTKLMGSTIDGTTTALPSENFQLVSLVTTGNVSADQICQDRVYHGSWQGDIAEIIIYDRVLTPAEELTVGTYLTNKYGLMTSYPLSLMPATPTGVIATAATSAGVRVSWASVPGAASYKVWSRNTQSGVEQVMSSSTSPSVVSGLVVGTPFEFKVSAVYANNTSGNYSSVVTATPVSAVSAYSTWAANAGTGLTEGMNNGPMDDPDRDGIPNMLEFALGGAPMSNSRTILPTMTMVGSNCVFEYSRSDVSQAGTSQVVEYSSDLRVWSQIAITDQSSGPVVVTAGNPSDRIKVTIPATAGQKMFTRLKVIQ